jgi:hypothetical protein
MPVSPAADDPLGPKRALDAPHFRFFGTKSGYGQPYQQLRRKSKRNEAERSGTERKLAAFGRHIHGSWRNSPAPVGAHAAQAEPGDGERTLTRDTAH